MELFTEKRAQMQEWMWRQRVERALGANAGLLGNGKKLHLLLGVACGGADHLARLILQSDLMVRFYDSPLAKFEPKPEWCKGGDRLSLPYERRLEPSHPINRIYRMLVEEDNPWAAQCMSNRLDQSDERTFPCLIKESRALLATQALLEELQATTLLYLGDPVKSIDRLFAQWGLQTPYLKNEARSLFSPQFLARFMRGDSAGVIETSKEIRDMADTRERAILHRILMVALIQHMFRRLALHYPQQVVLLEYNQLEQEPELLEEVFYRLMGSSGRVMGHRLLVTSTEVPAGKSGPVWREPWPDSAAEFTFLSEEEAEAGYSMLSRAGLGVGVRERVQDPLPSEENLDKLYEEFLNAEDI